MATYYALTSEHPRDVGYRIVAAGTDRAQVEQAALADIERRHGSLKVERLPGQVRDPSVFARTETTNLVVVSKSVAQRRFGVGQAQYEAWLGMED